MFLWEAASIHDIETAKLLHEYLEPIIKEFVSKKSNIDNLIKEISRVYENNVDVLQTPIVGRQLLINKTQQDRIMKVIGWDEKEMIKISKESPYLKLKPGDRDQIIFAVPLFMISYELYKIKTKLAESQSKTIYAFTFLRPYASNLRKYFTYGYVDEARMRYVVDNVLSGKYYIKQGGTVHYMLGEFANSSYNLFMDKMDEDNGVMTDKFFADMYRSGVASRLSSAIGSIYNEYKKAEGMKLDFERSTFDGVGDSEGETFDSDIESDAAVKHRGITKAMNKIHNINDTYIEFAAKVAFSGAGNGNIASHQKMLSKWTGSYETSLKTAIAQIIEKRQRELPEYLDAIISAFLYDTYRDPKTGQMKNYTADMIATQLFFVKSYEILKSTTRTVNTNKLKVREMTEDFLKSYSHEYNKWSDTQQRNLRNAVYLYFILLIQKG